MFNLDRFTIGMIETISKRLSLLYYIFPDNFQRKIIDFCFHWLQHA